MKRKQQVYYLGYIPDSLADEAGIMGGSIFLDQGALNHIANEHKKEFAQMKISAIDFVTNVAEKYTEIRQGSDNSLLLILRMRPNRVLAIRLHCYPKLHFYEVSTAFPMGSGALTKSELIYTRK